MTYTPSTDEIRAVWREWNSYGGLINRTGPEPTTRDEMVAEFDRWLTAEEARIRADQSRKIAEAIESLGTPEEFTPESWDHGYDSGVQAALEMINEVDGVSE